MGSCASVLRRSSEPDMKLRLSFGSKTDKIVIPPSLVKEKPNNGNFPTDDVGVKSQWSPSRSSNFRDSGSKEEAFFDSKPWLDSDAEDDFYSINGEFTPSRGSTPVHHSFRTPNVNKNPPLPNPSPTEKKKNLLELFRESVRHNHFEYEDTWYALNTANENKDVKPTKQDVLPKSAQSTPYISGLSSACDSERTMNDSPLSVRERSIESMQCCLPRLVSCRSFRERRKMSPAIAANGKNLDGTAI